MLTVTMLTKCHIYLVIIGCQIFDKSCKFSNLILQQPWIIMPVLAKGNLNLQHIK